MSDEEQAGSNDPATPQDRAMQATREALNDLQIAKDRADNAAEIGAAEEKHVSKAVDEVAAALDDGMNKPVGLFAGMLADETEYNTKTDLKQRIKDRTEEIRNKDKEALDDFVADRLESVTVSKTTDNNQGATYSWDFGTFKVETRSGKDGRGHLAWNQFRDLIFESGGVNISKPNQDRRSGDDWRDFMAGMIEERGETIRILGPRTKAVEKLENTIKQRSGYGTPEGALDHTGIWVVRETLDLPGWWGYLTDRHPSDDTDLHKSSVSEIRVHGSVISPIIDDAGIPHEALYHELKARNHLPAVGGPSTRKFVNGSNERFWTLKPSLAVPRTYVADPNANEQASGLSWPAFDKSTAEEEPSQESTETANPDPGGDTPESGGGFQSVGDTA
ncbi:hypothetical protein ACKVMT_06170 [Halobacteriales archaeon Cl-PHB]